MKTKKEEVENWRSIEDKDQEIKEQEWAKIETDEEQQKEKRNRERREGHNTETWSRGWRESIKQKEDELMEEYIARIEQITMRTLDALIERINNAKNTGEDEWEEK